MWLMLKEFSNVTHYKLQYFLLTIITENRKGEKGTLLPHSITSNDITACPDVKVS